MSPRAPSSQDEAAARALLEEGVAVLGLSLPATTLEALWRYAGLLVKWNRVYNLTAITRLEEVVTHHLLDALAVWPWVRQERVLVDVGSGAGLPGIVLALAAQAEGRPLEVHSLDAVAKKIAFQRQVAIELGLKGFHPWHERIERWQPPAPISGIISRAFARFDEFIALTRHLLPPGGRWYAMKGPRHEEELAGLPEDVAVRVVPLDVPGLAEARHLVIGEFR